MHQSYSEKGQLRFNVDNKDGIELPSLAKSESVPPETVSDCVKKRFMYMHFLSKS